MQAAGECKVGPPDRRTLISRTQTRKFASVLPSSVHSLLIDKVICELRPEWREGANQFDHLGVKHSRKRKWLVQRSWGQACVCSKKEMDWYVWVLVSERNSDLRNGQNRGEKSYHAGQCQLSPCMKHAGVLLAEISNSVRLGQGAGIWFLLLWLLPLLLLF